MRLHSRHIVGVAAIILANQFLLGHPRLAAAQGTSTRKDLYGDPLPEGVLFRLGTQRFHYPGDIGERPELVFLNDATLVSLHHCGLIIHWDPTTGKHLRHVHLPGALEAFSGWLSENGRVAAFWLGTPRAFSLRDTTTGHELRRIATHDFDRPYLSPDGSLVASWDHSTGPPFDSIRIWQVASTKPPQRLKCQTGASSSRIHVDAPIHFSADGKRLYYVSKDAFVYDAITGKQLLHVQPESGKTCREIAMSPDGKTVALVEGPPGRGSLL